MGPLVNRSVCPLVTHLLFRRFLSITAPSQSHATDGAILEENAGLKIFFESIINLRNKEQLMFYKMSGRTTF